MSSPRRFPPPWSIEERLAERASTNYQPQYFIIDFSSDVATWLKIKQSQHRALNAELK
jgi:hypothetical protein